MASHKEPIPQFRWLMVITTPKLEKKAEELFRKGAVPVQYRLNAVGTASSEMMDLLGLGDSDKRILIALLPKHFADIMLQKVNAELRMKNVNSGIAFTIPLSGANHNMLRMLSEKEGGIRQQEQNIVQEQNNGKDGTNMAESKHVLVASIVNRGFSEDVMAAARSAGAGGGTVVHSRRIGNEEVMGFWGIDGEAEKEIVMVLTNSDNKLKMMQLINEKCGRNSEANGVVLALPIDTVVGV